MPAYSEIHKWEARRRNIVFVKVSERLAFTAHVEANYLLAPSVPMASRTNRIDAVSVTAPKMPPS